ncbi:hypothetical protein ENBRE01_3083 [Enteropsectra breve]|nr:hypothetical protein ENBRE01_3083 [Enteropsectra breve]
MRKISIDRVKETKYHLSQGLSCRNVANKVGISVSTVHAIKTKMACCIEKQISGRPQKIGLRLGRAVLRYIYSGVLKNTTEVRKHILETASKSVSRETIRRFLKKHGLKSYAKPKKPRLLKHHKLARLRFAREYLRKPKTYWDNVIFTDESKYNLYGPDGNRRCWRLPNIVLQDHHIQPTVKFGGSGILKGLPQKINKNRNEVI